MQSYQCIGREVLEELEERVGLDGRFSKWRKVSGGWDTHGPFLLSIFISFSKSKMANEISNCANDKGLLGSQILHEW